MALTDQQKQFIEAYVECGNATEAAKQAGYAFPNKQGPRLLKNLEVKRELSDAMKDASVRVGVDGQWLMAQLHDCYLKFTQKVKPVYNSSGKPMTDSDGNAVYRFEAGPALKALELLGKMLGVFKADEEQPADMHDYESRLHAVRRKVEADRDNVVNFKNG